MTRLIDGNALIELINGGYDLDFDEVPETKRELLRMIMEQPTVDAVQVIRCKDCKYYRADGDCWHELDNGGWIYYQSVIDEPNPDDYCSRAERESE